MCNKLQTTTLIFGFCEVCFKELKRKTEKRDEELKGEKKDGR